MAWPTSLQVALKEWASVCRALERGHQIILLRKGGIMESGGEFEVEHRQFLLFPTYLHQNKDMIKPAHHEDFDSRTQEPETILLSAAGVVTDIIQLEDRAQMNAIDDHHIWTPPLIDMRFNYRPQNPLYLLLIRAYRLHEPTTIANTHAYAGCKSWVPLDAEIPTGQSLPVLDDVKYDLQRKLLLDRLKTSA